MWLADLALVAGVIVVVSITVALVVWTDNRLDRDRPGGTGAAERANGGAPPPHTDHRRRLRRTSDADDRR